jgi:hypothetical protein
VRDQPEERVELLYPRWIAPAQRLIDGLELGCDIAPQRGQLFLGDVGRFVVFQKNPRFRFGLRRRFALGACLLVYLHS